MGFALVVGSVQTLANHIIVSGWSPHLLRQFRQREMASRSLRSTRALGIVFSPYKTAVGSEEAGLLREKLSADLMRLVRFPMFDSLYRADESGDGFRSATLLQPARWIGQTSSVRLAIS